MIKEYRVETAAVFRDTPHTRLSMALKQAAALHRTKQSCPRCGADLRVEAIVECDVDGVRCTACADN